MRNCSIHMSCLASLLLLSQGAFAQSDYPWLRSADELYDRAAYSDAETMYRKALVEKPKPSTSYNLGNSVYQQNRMPEAIAQYQKAIHDSNDPDMKADAWYNLGNALYQNQEFDQSIRSYKESLKLRPSDEDAKKNLMLAMQQLQKQQQQQQQQEQQQQDQKPQDQPQQEQPQSDPKQKKEEQQSPETINEDEAREILKAIEREDQRVQEKLKKVNAKKVPPVKDW